MIKLATLFWLVLVTASGLAMFAVKYQVQSLDDRLNDTKKAVAAQERELRVLGAEWAYLNRPAALADMNQRFLSLTPIATKQLQSGVADIAMRPPPAPPPVPEPQATPPPEPAVAAEALAPETAAAAPLAGARLPGSGLPVIPASLEKPVREPARARPPAKSLDELIARVAAAR
jgi:hypothetical protein